MNKFTKIIFAQKTAQNLYNTPISFKNALEIVEMVEEEHSNLFTKKATQEAISDAVQDFINITAFSN